MFTKDIDTMNLSGIKVGFNGGLRMDIWTMSLNYEIK